MGKRITIEFIREYTKKFGYECLSDEYISQKANNLKFKCNIGHIFYTTWAHFHYDKSRCPRCYGNIKHTIDYIKNKTKELSNSNYLCLSNNYNGRRSKLTFKCNYDHIYEATWSNFFKGKRCPTCYEAFGRGAGNYKGGVTKLNIPLYDTYAYQLSLCEEIQRDPENNDWLQVRCSESNCNKWFNPSRNEVCIRIKSINSIGKDTKFYCSNECRNNCSVYKKQIYPRGFINTDNIRYDQTEWSNMVKERDKYQCIKCKSTDNLVAHHIEGLNENPLESADIDIGITLCKECHKLAHEEIGCRFVDMQKRNICNENIIYKPIF